MNLTLTREPADGLSVRGVLSQDPSRPSLLRGGDGIRVSTLENAAYLIPPGTYPLTVTYSPRFKRLMPLVSAVPGRSGIRFHPGTRPEHSKGCILVSRADEQHLTALLTNQTSTLTIV